LPCRGGILMTACVSMLKSRALPDMLPFSLCNKKRLAIHPSFQRHRRFHIMSLGSRSG
jgi:hypothetical protein